MSSKKRSKSCYYSKSPCELTWACAFQCSAVANKAGWALGSGLWDIKKWWKWCLRRHQITSEIKGGLLRVFQASLFCRAPLEEGLRDEETRLSQFQGRKDVRPVFLTPRRRANSTSLFSLDLRKLFVLKTHKADYVPSLRFCDFLHCNTQSLSVANNEISDTKKKNLCHIVLFQVLHHKELTLGNV